MKQLKIDIETIAGNIHTVLLGIEERAARVAWCKEVLRSFNQQVEIVCGTRQILVNRDHIVSIVIDEVETDD